MTDPAAVDPTKNVLDLVDAGMGRQDNLREDLGKLLTEMIGSLDRRMTTEFGLRDTATEKLSKADGAAITARNDSNAAAIAKTEAGFTKQIDGIAALIASAVKSLDDKIVDLKERLDRGEGHGKGLSDGWGWLVGAAGLAFAIMSYVKG